MQLTVSRAEIEAEQGKRSFAVFAKLAWSVIEPGTELLWSWHLDALCVHLQAVHEGVIHKLLINISPGHAKSSFVSVLYPVWCWLNDPHGRWLCASHSQDLSLRDNKNRRDLIESEWFQECYGHLFKLSSTQNVKSYFENNKRGYFTSVSVMSSCTGKRASNLLIDDANNAMAGLADIEAVTSWFGKTWTSRLNDQENGSMIVVGQRLHENDLSGHILQMGGWTHLNLPEEFETARRCTTYLKKKESATAGPITVEVKSFTNPRKKYKVVFADGKAGNCTCEARFFNPEEPCKHMKKAVMPASAIDEPFWTDPRTTEGELLWPEKFPADVIANLKRNLGSMNYAAQYQQSPVPASGGQVKAAWLRYYDDTLDAYRLFQSDNRVTAILKQSCWRFATVDLAISSKQSADYTVIAFWAVTHTNDLILFDLVRAHMDNPEQQRTIEALNQRYRPQYIVIESVAYQLALIQQLLARGIPCREYKPVRDKVSRFTTAAIWYENGKIYHPRNAVWLAEFESEILKFPRASHDDCADVVSMAAEQVVSPALPMQDDNTPPLPNVPMAVIAQKAIDPFEWADRHLGGGW